MPKIAPSIDAAPHAAAELDSILGLSRCGAVVRVSDETAWAECRGRSILVHPDVLTAGPDVLIAVVAHEVAHLRYRHIRFASLGRLIVVAFALVLSVLVLGSWGWVAALASLLAVRFLSALLGAAALRTCEVQADWAGARLLEISGAASNGPRAMASALECGSRQRIVLPLTVSLPPSESPLWSRWLHQAKFVCDLLFAAHAPVDLRVARLRASSRVCGILGSLRDAWLGPVTVAVHGLRQRRRLL